MANRVKPALRIAFAVNGGSGWIAGIHYFQNLFTAIRAVADADDVQIYLLPTGITRDSDLGTLASFANGILRVPTSEPPTNHVPPAAERPRIIDRIKRRIMRAFGTPPTAAAAPSASQPALPSDPNKVLGTYLREQGIDCLFASAEYGANFGVPLLSWIPDFQHKELPGFFGQQEIESRDKTYEAMCQHSTFIVLSSRHAESVFRQYYPNAAAKARVMPFVAQIDAAVVNLDLQAVRIRYNLPERFFFLPNQFWKHKNHGVVIRALSLAMQEHPDMVVACSGATTDYRDPNYFMSVQAEIAALGVDSNIRILGLIPEDDVFALMRQSIAIIQPSLYEGWSTVVEQAKSLGKSIVLSNLPVHIEQAPPACLYFEPSDADGLAKLLVERYTTLAPGPDAALEAEAARSLKIRTQDYGQKFLAIAHESISAQTPLGRSAPSTTPA